MAAEVPPPSYDSIFGQLKEAKEVSSNPVVFAKNSCNVFAVALGGCLTVFAIILCCGLGFALPIAEIVMGSINLHKCRANDLIPIYLIVNGVFSLLFGCTGGGKKAQSRIKGGEEEEDQSVAQGACSCLISTFLLAWMICGSVWVFELDGKVGFVDIVNGTADPLYCQETLYKFAFYELIVKYAICALMVVILCFSCCCCLCAYCVGKK